LCYWAKRPVFGVSWGNSIFWGQFCDVANQSGDHPKVKAKFGYLNLAIQQIQ
jgi:hypothetical protein